MRFDEIDLIGDFKIDGLTGDSGKAIGFSGSNIEWIDAASGGTPANALSTSGYNYVIVEATGTPTENGDTLKGVMANLASYINGTLTDNNRFTVLLMPGEYDTSFGGVIATFFDFVDIVGISSNPYDTIITHASNGPGFRINAFNQGWYNLYFKNCIIDEDGAATYLRWKNLVLGDDVFTGSNQPTNMIGEFEDITILGTCQFGGCTSIIDGIFNNINYVGVDSDAFIATSGGSINGTFSNIFANYVAGDCFTGASITGNFENITLAGGSNPFNVGGGLDGTFKNITIRNCGSAFVAESDAGSRFENIEIGEVPLGSVFDFTTFVTGTYKNITVGDVQGNAFRGRFEPACRFENIKVGGIGDFAFASTDGNLDGTFKNITIGGNQGCFFSATENVYGTYKDITINGNVNNFILFLQPDGCVFWAYNNFVISLENLTINGDVDGQVIFQYDVDTEDIDKNKFRLGGTFKNLKLGSVSGILLGHRNTGENMDLIVDGLEFNQVNELFTGQVSRLTASNINFNTIDSILSGNEGSGIDFTNIKGNTIGSGFQSHFINNCVRNFEVDYVGQFFITYYKLNDSQIPLFKNIKINNTNDIFNGNTNHPITGFFEDITIGSASNVFYVSASEGYMSKLNIRNLNISNASNVFYVVDTVYPTAANLYDNLLYNININKCTGDFFYGNTNGFAQTLIENVFIGTASRIFKNAYSSGKEIIVKNLYAKAELPNAFPNPGFSQLIVFKNSIIDMSDRDLGPTGDVSESLGVFQPKYQRCKVLALAGRRLSTFNSTYVLYSAFTKLNSDIIGGGASSLYNVQDPDLS